MSNRTIIPAFKAQVGNWPYYICIMKYAEVAKQISFAYELGGGNKDLQTLIQRGLSERTKEIYNYLLASEHRFLGALIVAVWGGDPKYQAIEMADPDGVLKGIDQTFGLLTFDGTQSYFALDGQHRLKAIKDAVKSNPEIGREDICVLMVSHYDTDDGRTKTRRLFSNINRNAKVFVRSKADQSIMAPLTDDWATQGEWLGRYGTDWACLCAFCSPDDYIWGARSLSVRYNVWPGKNFSKDDTTRAWVHSLATRDRRALEMPRPYYQSRVEGGYSGKESDRRQSEWDDHGEAYAITHDGPHMMVKLSIPEGFFKLSLYNNNKDGHDGSNRFRDYMCYFRRDVDGKNNNTALAGYSGEILSVMRFNDFWSGCYKNAVIKGPVTVWLETNKNRSFNTILAAIMLTNLDYASTLNWFGIKFPALDRLGVSSDPSIVRIVRLRGFIERAKSEGRVTVYAMYGARIYSAIYLETQRALKTEANSVLRAELLAVLAESSYHIGEWKENELALKELALGNPRNFEMSLKWDGKRNMNGMESMLMPLPAN